MRNATHEHAVTVLRQCGNNLSMKVQYNPESESAFPLAKTSVRYESDALAMRVGLHFCCLWDISFTLLTPVSLLFTFVVSSAFQYYV